MIPLVEHLAFAMFEQNALTFVTEAGSRVGIEKLWNDDPGVRRFWQEQAQFAIDFIELERGPLAGD